MDLGDRDSRRLKAARGSPGHRPAHDALPARRGGPALRAC